MTAKMVVPVTGPLGPNRVANKDHVQLGAKGMRMNVKKVGPKKINKMKNPSSFQTKSN